MDWNWDERAGIERSELGKKGRGKEVVEREQNQESENDVRSEGNLNAVRGRGGDILLSCSYLSSASNFGARITDCSSVVWSSCVVNLLLHHRRYYYCIKSETK